MHMKNRKTVRKDGFTLPELLITTVILAIVLVGMLTLFLNASVLGNYSTNKTLVMIEVQNKLEEIRSHSFTAISADYASGGAPGDTFDLTLLPGKGKIYIDSTKPDLLEIEVVVSYQNQNGRVIGEDADLDGVLDAGEDTDSNGKLSSEATLVTMVAHR